MPQLQQFGKIHSAKSSKKHFIVFTLTLKYQNTFEAMQNIF